MLSIAPEEEIRKAGRILNNTLNRKVPVTDMKMNPGVSIIQELKCNPV
jgi:hypothetical protein